jgi:hypothetical protein
MFFGIDNKRKLAMMDVLDGTSNTFMIGENSAAIAAHAALFWYNHVGGTTCIPPNAGISPRTKPDGSPFNRNGDFGNLYSFRSFHPGGLQFALVDGSVRFVSQTIDMRVYRGMASIKGGEVARLE